MRPIRQMPALTPNARFWAWVGSGLVKITLRDGQTLRWRHSEPTEEGWSSEFEEWEYEHGVVTRRGGTDGHDCDGRLSSWYELECSVSNLSIGQPAYREPDINMPVWRERGRGQRDYAAEAMGY